MYFVADVDFIESNHRFFHGRKMSGKVEIAYGHHRMVALQELGIKEVDIPVKALDDATMIKIMANENMEDWETNTSVINETVLTVTADAACLRRASVEIAPYSSACDSERTKCAGRAG